MNDASPIKAGGNIAAEKLQSFIERIEKLMEEKADISSDIREVFSEAQGHGFDVPVMREVLKLRKMEKDKLQAHTAQLDLYRDALGM